MYKAYIDGKLLYAPDTDDLRIIDPVVTLAENAAGSFTFKLTRANPYYDSVLKRKTIISVTYENEIVFQGIAVESNDDIAGLKEIVCEGELTYFNDSIQRPARYQGYSVRGLLEAYVNVHNSQVDASRQFRVGMVTVKDSNDYIYCYTNMETTMECLKHDLVEDLGGYLRIRYEGGVRYLDYLEESMHTSSQAIMLGVNLLDYSSNIDSTEIATAIIPLGAIEEETKVEGLDTRLTIADINGGRDFVYNQQAVDRFGWIYKTIVFDNVTTPAALKRKGEDALSISQFENVYVEVTAVDMHYVDPESERIRLSDSIRVVSSQHGMNRYMRCTSLTMHLLAPQEDTFTLGKKESLGLSARTAQVSDGISQAIKSITPASKILNSAKENLTAVINGNGENGNLVFRQNDKGVVYELLFMDTTDMKTAREVLRINKNGIGFSVNGVDGPYNTAWGINSQFVADFITAGTMLADRIRGGKFIVGGKELGADGEILGLDEDGNTIFQLNKKGGEFKGDISAAKLGGGAGDTLSTAFANASTAISTAEATASTANSTAVVASTAAYNASTAASTANSTAAVASTAAYNASTAASTANYAASTANSLAAAANQTAYTANSAAYTASVAASTAGSTAAIASTAAATANSAASTANSLANAADSKASGAKTSIDNLLLRIDKPGHVTGYVPIKIGNYNYQLWGYIE